ncbi:MAG TPA: antibiotic biosynthesis monooxygenase [Bacillota bacterium]|nr:antibiotic biosynthesis monooxygenase [Bacillota bacterium]
MRAFMTVGTLTFLQRFTDKYPKINFYYMNNMYENSTLIYYEHKRKKVFTAGKTYNIIFSLGALQTKGFVALETIPVTKDGQPFFESQIQKQLHIIEQVPGFFACRLLKIRRGQEYIFLSQWKSPTDYETWQNNREQTIIKQPAYFASRPFTTNYLMADLDDEKKND